MKQRQVIAGAVLSGLVVSAVVMQAQGSRPASAAARNAEAGTSGWAPPRTPDGKPDLQGYWSNATYTPVERPAEFKDREFFTVAEAAAYTKRAQERFLSQPDDDAHYDNSIWMTEKAEKGVTTLRTSIIVEPADGRLPPFNAEGRARNEAPAAARKRVGLFDSAQTRGMAERCIYWAHEGPPVMPTGYNSNVEIVQSPGEFVMIPEMMPAARIVPLDGRRQPGPAIRELHGVSRGRWENDTLVVETANFTDRTAFRGSSEHLRVTERFTLIDADTIRYQFTVEDPHTWDVAWKGEYPMKRLADTRYEYACHEGNYGMPNILRAQRLEEERARTGAAAARP
jgi:hypothetical protein